LELRQLEYYCAVCQYKKITVASQQLHVSQPAVTVAIKKLEDELGTTLFVREQKGLIITPEGKLFLQHAKDILSRINNAVIEMNDLKREPKGKIRLGIPPLIGTMLIPEIYPDFNIRYPLIRLILTELGALKIENLLKQGNLDLAIICPFEKNPLIRSVPVLSGNLMVCLPLNHPLAKLSCISMQQLSDENFLLFNEGTQHRNIVNQLCNDNHIKPHIGLVTNQVDTIRRLISNGAGISFLFEGLVSKSNNMVTRPLAEPVTITYRLCWNTDRYLTEAEKYFINFVKRKFCN